MADNKISAFKEVYQKLADKLSFITINEQTVELLKKDKSFEASFEQQLATLKKLETKLKIKDKKAPDLIAACNQITGKSELTANAIDFKDPEDIEDNLHFLDVYLTNVLGEDFINKFINQCKDKNNVQEANTKVEPEVYEAKTVDGEEVHDFSSANTTNLDGSKPFNAEDFLRQNNVSAESMADQIILNQARVLVNRDISTNKLYKFDSKPKIVIWLKMINLIFFGLFILTTAVAIIFSFSAPGTIYNVGDKQFSSFGGGSVDPFLVVALVLIILSIGTRIYTEVKYFKNENYRYSVKLGYLFISILVFILYMNMFTSWIQGFNNWDPAHQEFYKNSDGVITTTAPSEGAEIFHTNPANSYSWMKALYALAICSITLFSLMVLFAIILFIIRPKVDFNAIQQRTLEYINKIKSGQISVDDLNPDSPLGGSGFGGMLF